MRDWFVYYETDYYPWAEIVRAEKAIDAVRHPNVPYVIARADGLAFPPDVEVAKKLYADLVQEGKT